MKKSRGHFRAGFIPWFPPENVFEVDTAGLTSPVLERWPFEKIPRPSFPMDTDTVVQSVQKTNRCVTIEEGWPVCSIGNHISATLMQQAFDWLDAPVINLTGKDVPMPYAANLEKLALVTTAEVIEAAKAVCYR